MIFTTSTPVIEMVNELAVLLAFTILLNCIQPVLSGKILKKHSVLEIANASIMLLFGAMWFVSGAAVGSGWQAIVAFVNIGSYYIVGVPLGVLLGWLLGFGIRVPVFHCYQHFRILGSMYSSMVNRTTVVFLNLPWRKM